MPKPATKTATIEVSMTPDQKKLIALFAALNKTSMSEYLLDCAMRYSHDTPLEVNFHKEILSILKQQQRSTFIMMQFIMHLMSFSAKSKDEVMKFYENAYREAVAEFGKEDD